jgi:predicted acetyltransferase
MAVSPIWHYFGRSAPSEDQVEALARVLPAERVHAAWDGDRVIGGAGAFPFELSVPGGRIRAAGVTVVGVLPSHRRRGVLRAMMRAQLDACREQGESVAYLWASEDTIYGRFGYGMASLVAEIDLARERSAYHAPAEPLGQRDSSRSQQPSLVAAVWERVAAVTPGMFARTSAWWQARSLADPPGGGVAQESCSARCSRSMAIRRRTRSIVSTRRTIAGSRPGRSTSSRPWATRPSRRARSGASCSTSTGSRV